MYTCVLTHPRFVEDLQRWYCIYTYMYIHKYVHICICTHSEFVEDLQRAYCIYVHICIYVWICVYIYIHTSRVRGRLAAFILEGAPNAYNCVRWSVFSSLPGHERGYVCCSVLQFVAVWCSVVQCGAEWCSVVWCVCTRAFDDLFLVARPCKGVFIDWL